jgi:hypothetical protein
MQRNLLALSWFRDAAMSSLLLIFCSRGEYVHTRFARSKGNGIKGVGRVAHKEARTAHTTNILYSRQYFVSRCLSFYVGNGFGLHCV